MWAYENYNIIPDLILAGKGMSSSLPIAALIGRAEVVDHCDLATLNSTHSGNPLCCIAAYANIQFLLKNQISDHVKKMQLIFVSLTTLRNGTLVILELFFIAV